MRIKLRQNNITILASTTYGKNPVAQIAQIKVGTLDNPPESYW